MTRMRVVALGLLAGCGPQVVEPADLDEVCEEKGPVRILELEEDELFFGAVETDRFAERRILTLMYRDESADPFIGLEGRHYQSWSVGMCGESPFELDTEQARRWDHAWPDVLVGCRPETGEVLVMDPLGERESNVVIRNPGCAGSSSRYGLVVFEAHDDESGAVRLFPWVEDPWTETAEPRVILDPIRGRVSTLTGSAFGEMEVGEDTVFAITPTADLVSVSLVDTMLTTEATDVVNFQVSDDDRWVIWQDAVVTNADPAWPAGAVYLKDRTTGTTLELADAPLLASVTHPLRFIDEGIVILQLGDPGTTSQRLFFLDGGSVTLAPGTIVLDRLDDGRWLVAPSLVGPWSLFDADFESSRPLFENEGLGRHLDDGLEIVEINIFEDFDAQLATEAPVWFVPWDGERELLAGRAVQSYNRLADDRIVTPVDVGAGWLGTLIVGAPEPDDERVIDERVLPYWSVHADDEAMIYGVLDGERTGVWLTKLADTASR